MLRTNSLHFELICHVLETTLEILATPHQILDVIDTREPEPEHVKELRLSLTKSILL
jgi:hypothetical protein